MKCIFDIIFWFVLIKIYNGSHMCDTAMENMHISHFVNRCVLYQCKLIEFHVGKFQVDSIISMVHSVSYAFFLPEKKNLNSSELDLSLCESTNLCCAV